MFVAKKKLGAASSLSAPARAFLRVSKPSQQWRLTPRRFASSKPSGKKSPTSKTTPPPPPAGWSTAGALTLAGLTGIAVYGLTTYLAGSSPFPAGSAGKQNAERPRYGSVKDMQTVCSLSEECSS